MTTYIAGPMTGLPDFNYPAFKAAAADLRSNGIDVLSPAELHGPDVPDSYTSEQTWEWYLRAALKALLECDAVVLLPGWESSRGAVLERHIAETLGMAITDLSGVSV